MKSLLAICLLLIISQKIYSQNCGVKLTPQDISAMRIRAENIHSEVIYLPLVFHILHNPLHPEENISDSLIYSQLDRLNLDFRRLNADTIQTHEVFDSVAVDTKIEFCLANLAPSGLQTSGIHRIITNKTSFYSDSGLVEHERSESSGGVEPWPVEQYINIWVCNLTDAYGDIPVFGYSSIPGTDFTSIEGVTVHYEFVGDLKKHVQYSLDSTYVMGRVLTHELGHYLGLYHTWLSSESVCDSIGDLVDDTPVTNHYLSWDCPSADYNSCSNESAFWGGIDPIDMTENYMDYTAEDCKNMFSKGQMIRMHANIDTFYPQLAISSCVSAMRVSKPKQKIFSIKPNPVYDKLTIEGYNISGKNFSILSIDGQILKQGQITRDRYSVVINELEMGYYFLHIQGLDLTEKFIILQ